MTFDAMNTDHNKECDVEEKKTVEVKSEISSVKLE